MVVGMLAGEEGPGAIHYNDIQSAHLIGTLALAIILFDGGMRTRAGSFRAGLWPALSLATLGVLGTTLLTGLFAAWVFDLHWLQGLLLGAIVGSTDAAAVFSLLHAHGLELKQRVAATLEIESGSNDPMAVFLTIALVEILASGTTDLSWKVLGTFVLQMGLGALIGIAAGRLLVWLINRLTLASGLYPLLAMAGGVLAFAATTAMGGSGFLAIYLIGLIVGNSQIRAVQNILRVHDGMAWLSQITMFLMLGLLVTPSELLPVAPKAMLIALVLMLIARPFSVWVGLLPFRFPWREQVFIAWVGLRGAVPIILALFPLLAGLEQAEIYFNVAFFVVLVSLLLQGWTIAPVARLLGLEVPPKQEPYQSLDLDVPGQPGYELLGYVLEPESMALNRPLNELPMPEQARITAVIRDAVILDPGELKKLVAGDYIYVLTKTHRREILNKLFADSHAPARLEERKFFGEFILHGEASMDELSAIYGLDLPPSARGKTVQDYLTGVFNKRPVIGDRIKCGGLELVVRETDDGRVTKAGLKLHD